jgi:hypothetical protein
MLRDSKLKSIVDLYVELLPLKQIFPTIIFLDVHVMTMLFSSTTLERTFRKRN